MQGLTSLKQKSLVFSLSTQDLPRRLVMKKFLYRLIDTIDWTLLNRMPYMFPRQSVEVKLNNDPSVLQKDR